MSDDLTPSDVSPDTGPFEVEPKPKRTHKKKYRVITNTLFTTAGRKYRGEVVKLAKAEAEAAMAHKLVEAVGD